ncbi:MAG: hypothetical protein JWL70_2594, partial [Acidimicrobiia bacterium]|nr:hypothetical protein [Acidimicrobiia bacterium]
MIDPVENLPGLNRMMQIMALVGQGAGSGAGASL